MSNQHIENSLAKIRVIFEKAAQKIDALKPGEKLVATTLALDLAKGHDMTGPTLYPTLKFLFDGYPNTKTKKGAQGGIYKLGPDDKEYVNPDTIDQDSDSFEKEPLPIINT